MKLPRAHAKRPGVAADFIERGKAIETIKGRVLNAFGHGRSGQLLETRDEMFSGFPALLRHQQVVDELKSLRENIFPSVSGQSDRRVDHVTVRRVRFATGFRNVRTVYGKTDDDLGESRGQS